MPEFISDMLHCNNGPLGLEMANADMSRDGESHYIPLIGVDQMLMTNQMRCDRWAQLYKDLFCRSSNWEKIDRPHQYNDTILFTVLGFSEKPVAIIRRSYGNMSVIYAADEFYINNPERLAQVTNNV